MTKLKNKYLNGIPWVLITLLLVVCFLIIASSYFNTKEISSVTSQCYENGGEAILEIHNNITNKYSFECK
ncbi:hypothetical protein [Neobacillus sp. FSL H8-0543]|uniref:hypothetical protein n=1 Tax=Neobacillus sp. FSL H8-0543 TaxID=2954672 RepID=UPI0031592A64